MKALLVYPWFPDTYWSFRHALWFYGKRSFFPPLGLLTISALLPDHWERRLVDMNVSSLLPDDVEWSDTVFVSAMHVQRDSLNQVIKLAKEHGKQVVIGGPYASICADQLTEADHIFVGEAETTFPEFIRDLESCRASGTLCRAGSRLSAHQPESLRGDARTVFARLPFQLRVL